MRLEIRDINHAAILNKHYHERTVIDFGGVSLAIVGASCNYQPYRTIWGFEFAEVPKASSVNGLPPIGTHVFVYDPEGLLIYGAGEEGEVLAHVENTAVVRMSYGLGCFAAKHLRTKERIATEERHQALLEMGCIEPALTTCMAGKLYDAGYRKV